MDSPKQESHPNLKKGNTKNVGRLRSEVRAIYLQGADAGAALMAKVAAGEKCIRVPGGQGSKAFRYPSFQEQALATKLCAEYGLGTQKEVMGKDGGPIEFNSSDADRAKLLDKLSEEDLAAMEAIAERAYAAPVSE